MYVFEMVSCNRSYLLRAGSSEEKKLWIEAITTASKLTIDNFYKMEETVGRGTFSEVIACTSREDGVRFAVKVIDKVTLSQNREALLTEIKILKQVKHPNVSRNWICTMARDTGRPF